MKNNESNDTPIATDWSQLYQYRRATQKRYPSIWHVPLRKRHHQVVRQETPALDSLLELGAGARNLQDELKKTYSEFDYKSFDIDRQRFHDFYSLEEINGEYQVACMFEVIEHVTPTIALNTLQTAFRHVKPGGKIFVTTPNIYYPPEYLRDATHITPWCYDELGGIVQMAGFELDKIYRLHQDPLLTKILRRYLTRPLFQLLGLDFAKQIIAVGKKPA
ncbi:hypothetical protein NBRC116494_29800 [Aurantivibrio plasticivorans]